SHDDNLRRFGHPDKTVSCLAASEIQQTIIPSPDGRYRGRMLTLETLLQAYPTKDYIFDCKISRRELFEKLRGLLQRLGVNGTIWFLTWSREGDRQVRSYFPECACFPRFTRSQVWGLLSAAGLGRILEPRNPILSLPAHVGNVRVFTKRQVESIRARGKTFLGYLVNTEKDFEHCRACGVDSVLTDRPDLVAELAGRSATAA
ncbi:MAG: hypothetical protein D6743_16030, partial [Calditrichaeota bacterium]